ncbi:Uncharacterised protein [Klebsiella variicola]|uniref:hypothetical protein n=1 Tax=Klebsiella TaxID=570 RepID=UPI000E2A4022|nr:MULTISPECIES: hypothetical protein [Klebsiella]SXF43160.1 Uncharacterised protein [Klebsiella variicola]
MRFFIYKSWARVENQTAYEVTSERRDEDTDTSVAFFDCEVPSLAIAHAVIALQKTTENTNNCLIFRNEN